MRDRQEHRSSPFAPTRREWIGAAAGAAAFFLASPLLRAAARRAPDRRRRRLLVIELRGGNDGFNTLVPFDDDAYRRSRPQVGLAATETLKVDTGRGLHPALARIHRRYQEGQVALIEGIGSPVINLSHFLSRDMWDTARVAPPFPGTGWLGRCLDVVLEGEASPTASIAVGAETPPRSLAATRSMPCAVPSLERYRVVVAPPDAPEAEVEARTRALLSLERARDPILAPIAEAERRARASVAALAPARDVKLTGEYPQGKLGRDVALAARILLSGADAPVLHVAHDGYDTHTQQGDRHPELLAALDQALDALLLDLERGGLLDQTLVMTVSEFGRRVAENGIGASAGTDHGAASVSLLLGAGVRPGIHGRPPRLDDLDENGNAAPTVDFRRLYAAVIARHFGADPAAILGGEHEPLEVLA